MHQFEFDDAELLKLRISVASTWIEHATSNNSDAAKEYGELHQKLNRYTYDEDAD